MKQNVIDYNSVNLHRCFWLASVSCLSPDSVDELSTLMMTKTICGCRPPNANGVPGSEFTIYVTTACVVWLKKTP